MSTPPALRLAITERDLDLLGRLYAEVDESGRAAQEAYQAERDAHRATVDLLAKSEEERATQSAHLAAAMAEAERWKRDFAARGDECDEVIRTLMDERDQLQTRLASHTHTALTERAARLKEERDALWTANESLKAARAEMDRREKQDAWDAGYIRGRDTVADDLAKAEAARAEWERRYVEAETRANYWAEQFNEQSSRRIAAESERDALRRAEAGRECVFGADPSRCMTHDVLVRGGKCPRSGAAKDATDEEIAQALCDAFNGSPTWDTTLHQHNWSAVARLVVRRRLAALQAKVSDAIDNPLTGRDAWMARAKRMEMERDEWRAKAEAAEARANKNAVAAINVAELMRATPDEAKAAGEGRVVGEPVKWAIGQAEGMLPVHRATMGRLTLEVTEGRETPVDDPRGGRMPEHEVYAPTKRGEARVCLSQSFWTTVDEAKRAAVSFALSLNGATLAKTHAHLAERDRCFGCGDSSPAVRCSLCATCAEAVTGRTLAQPRASMLTAMAEVGMLVGLDVPQDKTDREVWNVFGNRVREEVKARLAAGADADRRAREALDRVVGAYAKGRADAMRTFAQPADAEWLAMSSLVQDGWRVLVERHRDNTQTGPTPEVAAAFSEHVAYPHAPCYVAQPADARCRLCGHAMESHGCPGAQPADAGRDAVNRWIDEVRECSSDAMIGALEELRAIVNGATPDAPTSPAKPADRYVVVGRDKVAGRPARFYYHQRGAEENAAFFNDHAKHFKADESPLDGHPWAVVDTATAPQPSPRAVGPVCAWCSSATKGGEASATMMLPWCGVCSHDSHPRPNVTIGAQPAVALTEAPLAATMAKVLSAFGEPGMTWRSEASAIVAALGPVAIPAGIDREALIAARTCVMAHGGPGMSRMVQAIDGVIRAGDAGKADAVTVGIDREALTWARRYMNAETGFDKPMHVRAIAALDAIRAGQPNAVTVEEIVEAWNMSIGDGEKAIRRILAPHVGKVIAGAVKP